MKITISDKIEYAQEVHKKTGEPINLLNIKDEDIIRWKKEKKD